MPETCEFCGDDAHGYCDCCGYGTTARTCPSCGHFTCEIEGMLVGDAREARGLPRTTAFTANLTPEDES
jgi:hypothetical protein